MQIVLELAGVLLLFGVGLRLSAFFSGSETGFYRMSLPRISIDAQLDDPVARRLLWFSHHPAHFVATTLIGNNLANYLTTFGISLGVVTIFGRVTEALDVGSTLLLSPVIFLFGELIPKNLYYRAPNSLLRRDATLFSFFYVLFLPLSLPLVQIARFLERYRAGDGPQPDVVLGKSRLVQLMSQGRSEGVLTDVQNRLVNGVLQVAPQRITESMIPVNRVLGMEATATREELLSFARQFGTPTISLRREGEHDWFAYVRAVDLAIDSRPVARLAVDMPVLTPQTTKLDALQHLLSEGALQGVIVQEGRTLGIVNTRGLVEQLFRPVMTTGA